MKDVSVVQKDKAVAEFLALALQVSADAGHGAVHGTALDEIVWKEGSVYVAGFYDA